MVLYDFKTSNINYFIQALPKEANFVIHGIRKENQTIENYAHTHESKISNQVVAMPIIDWSDFDVWLYIRYKNFFNDAYSWAIGE